MKESDAIELLKGMQNPKVDYADLVCAPAFCCGYQYVYPEPEDYAIEEAISALKEIRQYREIGTVEECREARDKQKSKNPKESLKVEPVIDGNGAYVDANTMVYLLCPNCGEMVGLDDNCDRFCRECGQAIETKGLTGVEE